VNFEKVEINVATADDEILNNAILSVGRNGVAIKGTV